MNQCRHCNSWNTIMSGYTDGCGDDGDGICELHLCEDCYENFEIDRAAADGKLKRHSDPELSDEDRFADWDFNPQLG